MFQDTIITNESVIMAYRCFVCGYISDTLSEMNKQNPPPPPENRGRKPNFLVRIEKRKPVKRKVSCR